MDTKKAFHWILDGVYSVELAECNPATRACTWVDHWTLVPITWMPITWWVSVCKEVAGRSPECSHRSPYLLSILSGTCWGETHIKAADDVKLWSVVVTRNRTKSGETTACWNDGTSNKMKSTIDGRAFIQLGSKHQLCMCREGRAKMRTVVQRG